METIHLPSFPQFLSLSNGDTTKCKRFSEIIKVRCCTQHLELSKNSKSCLLFPRWQKEPPELRLGVKLCMSFASQDIVFLSQRMCIDAIWEYDKGRYLVEEREEEGKKSDGGRDRKRWERRRRKNTVLGCLYFVPFFILVFFFFFWLCCVACRVLVPNQGSNLCHLHWELGVLATGQPGPSPLFYFKHIMSAELGQIPECHDTSELQLSRLYLFLK